MKYLLSINGLTETLMKTGIFLHFIQYDNTLAKHIANNMMVNVKSETIIAIHHNNG